MSPAEPCWEVRPPWPDEIPRLVTHFGLKLEHPVFDRTWLWAVVTAPEERLVSLFQLLTLESGPMTGLIDFTVRNAWVPHESTLEGLKCALAKAAELELTAVRTQADPASAVADLLRRLGFTAEPTREVWVLSVQAGIRSTAALTARILKRYAPPVEPLNEQNLPAVTALCKTLGLLSADRVKLLTPGENDPAAFDPRLSFVTIRGSRASAIILSRMVGGSLYLEVVGRHPELGLTGQRALAALLHTFFHAARDLGLEEVHCTI